MRPLSEIPDTFFEFQEPLDEPLPVLERWLARQDGAPLEGITVLQVQHQLANQFGQTEALCRLGADPERIHWLDIPYTSHAALRDEVVSRLGVPARNFRTCDDYRVLDPYAPYQHRRAVELLTELVDTGEPLLVLDDGAYILAALASLRRERWPRRIAMVEQTTRGVIKLRKSAALRAAAAEVAIVNVAESTPKRTLEPPFIALSICASLDRALRTQLDADTRSLVLGYGAIGEQVASYLKLGLGIEHIAVHDPSAEHQDRARDAGFRSWDKANLTSRFDLVIGCSGQASFGIGDRAYLGPDALLASASSGAVELSRGAFIELADASPLDDIEVDRAELDESNVHSHLRLRLVDRHATVLNSGFPVNFDGRLATTPARYIQPTPTMMVAAAVQAAAALESGERGLLTLDPKFCGELDRDFREELGPDADHLLPPPERAW